VLLSALCVMSPQPDVQPPTPQVLAMLALPPQ
jgi:hypothetical protein